MCGKKGRISLYLNRTEKSYRAETNEQDPHYTFVTLHNMGTHYQVIFTTMMLHVLTQLFAKQSVTTHLIMSLTLIQCIKRKQKNKP